MEKVTSTEIKIALSKYHEKDFFITECKTCSTYFPDPQGLLKFDGYAVRKSYTRQCLTGYEIKVSRGDFLQDNKWHLYLQYCNEFYFVVPAGLIQKDELPEDVGLIYYYPEKGTLKTKKRAAYRTIEEPVGVYKYIIFSRLEQDRTPFYEKRAEYARDYLEDKREKRNLGRQFGSKLAKDLREAQEKLRSLQQAEVEHEYLQQIRGVLRSHGIESYHWEIGTQGTIKRLEEALSKTYPEDLDAVEARMESALEKLREIREREEKNHGRDKSDFADKEAAAAAAK